MALDNPSQRERGGVGGRDVRTVVNAMINVRDCEQHARTHARTHTSSGQCVAGARTQVWFVFSLRRTRRVLGDMHGASARACLSHIAHYVCDYDYTIYAPAQ